VEWSDTALRAAVSFLAAAWFLSANVGKVSPARARPQWLALARRLRIGPVFSALSVAVLVLAIATGALGTPDPNRNFSMTAFWIYFVLVLTYLTALAGNVYAVVNPWRAIAECIGRFWPAYLKGRVRYPERLDVLPAAVLYAGFIGFELLTWVRPHSLAAALVGYTLLNLFAVWLIGADAWFRFGEFFSVMLRLVSLVWPIAIQRDASGISLATRSIGAGILQERPAYWPTALFLLLMLSSTAFDGMHGTKIWYWLFWRDPTGIVHALVGADPVTAIVNARPWYFAWEWTCLAIAPFLYLALYFAALLLSRWLAGSARPLRELALDFAFPLLPIVLAYHVSHYFTLILTQGPGMLSLLSDPFGWQWNLFGTREVFRAPIIPDLTFVWHSQVFLIVLGHVASVVLAHRVALRVFPGRGRAIASQLPMLALMVGFTVLGLWILAQPLEATLIR